jgi:ABC-type antimicrobial peptide transport system permease subunit
MLERRLKEIGIRVALGASRPEVFRVVVGGAVWLTVIGVAIGSAVAAAATRLLSALLYGLSPTDPLTFAGIAALLLLVTLTAGYAAARKGLNVDPVVVLRYE